MSTISNERLEEMRDYDTCVRLDESAAMATELLALRKERERAEPVVCPKCGNTGLADSGGVQPWGEPILIECDCTAPPAPVVPEDVLAALRKVAKIRLDFNDFDGDRRGMADCLVEAEEALIEVVNRRAAMLQSGNDEIGSWGNHKTTPTDNPKSEMSQQAEQLLRDTTALAVTLSAETDTTSQQFESLAGKAVGDSEGFECTPVADLYELLTKCGECYDYTTSAKVAADWIKEGYSAREYVKLDRLQEAMAQGSDGDGDGWIPCSDRA
ncbi:hypothetical protein [Cronobacter sakazakii]|uniref:hypothetical protein n=1 Tax=Cronobacter sakazakii TaxID=28141 RepID=UPI0018F87B2D|nr:hypothetical protein [Cronobacter sakazakii]